LRPARAHPRISTTTKDANGSDRMGDVFDQLLAQILEKKAATVSQMIAHAL
jgi:hypothetical protein